MGLLVGLVVGLGLVVLVFYFGFGEGFVNMMMIGLLILVVVMVIGFVMCKKVVVVVSQQGGMQYVGVGYGGKQLFKLDFILVGGFFVYVLVVNMEIVLISVLILVDFDVEGFVCNVKVNFICL